MIAIKDMDMPNDCRVCPFTERIPPGRTRCLLTCRMLAENYHAPLPERNEYCPLVDIKWLRELKEQKGEMMDDLISRAAAIDILYNFAGCIADTPGDWYKAFEKYKYDLENLPSAQPERKTGRWIYGEHDVAMCDGYYCSECGFFVPWDYKRKFIDFIKEYNFCPKCGNPMQKEGEG